MLKEANRFVIRLWKDESGMVLALSVVVFLVLFVMACAVYAVGETVRQRVELQNAADAAAYSGAVVEAETISRIAAINQAMAWTYVQMGRMEMDYIADKWLERVLQLWDVDSAIAQGFAEMSTCTWGPMTGSDDWYAGEDHWRRRHVLLNKSQWVAVRDIRAERTRAAAAGKNYGALAPKIDEARLNIKHMNRAEGELIAFMPDRIKHAVLTVLKKNVSGTVNDSIAGGADFMCSILPIDTGKMFLKLTQGEEDLFLIYGGYLQGDRQTFGKGTGDWWTWGDESGARIRGAGEVGIQRSYYIPHQNLIAEWWWHAGQWHEVGDPPVCMLLGMIGGHGTVRGEDVRSAPYFTTALSLPWKIRKEYFAKGGAVVVGVSRRMNNPFHFIYGSEGESGVFRPFTLNGRNRFMWGVSAAIAAFNPEWPAPSAGRYDPTHWDISIVDQNLRNSDWDAVLLPLHRAWAQGQNLEWDGESAGQILQAVAQGGWQTIHGGGGAIGVQSAPPGMRGGGQVAWDRLEALTLH